MIRTSQPESGLVGPGTARACKRPSSEERAFRSLETVNPGIRHFCHRTAPPVRARFIRCAVACCVKRQMHRRPKALAVRRRRCGTPHRRVSALSTGAGAEAGTKTTPDGEPGNLTATVTGSTNEDSGAAAARSARRRRKRQTYLSNATEPTSSICSSMVKRQMPMWPLRKSPFASQSMLPETPW